MYSSILVIGSKIDIKPLLQMLNDEGRSEDLIELSNQSDLIVIRFNSAAVEAQSIIDGYLSNYELPLSPVPQRLIDISDDLTIYNVYKRRNRENIPDSVISTYNQAIKSLESIQKGLLKLPVAEKSTTSDQGSFLVNKTPADKTFSKDLMMRF